MLQIPDGQSMWIDRNDFEAEFARRLNNGSVSERDKADLKFFRENGYIIFRRAIEDSCIQKFERQYDAAKSAKMPLRIREVGNQPTTLDRVEGSLKGRQYRIMRAETLLPSLREVMLHKELVSFLSKCMDDAPVAMQSLVYDTSSQQEEHADYPYVKSTKLGVLIAAWVAFESADEENGALFYYPGSHRLPKYDWGESELSVNLNRDDIRAKTDGFTKFLQEQVRENSIERKVFNAERGDVLLWHAGLIHGGLRHKGNWSRRSAVFHYTAQSLFEQDRTMPDNIRKKYNGAYYFERPKRSERLPQTLSTISL